MEAPGLMLQMVGSAHPVVEKYVVFKTLYVDRAGIFGGPKRCNFSQMQRACEELGIEIIFASSP